MMPPNWKKTPRGRIAREMLAILKPNGEMVIGTDLCTEADAWRIATGWGGSEEIEQRQREGWRCVNVVVLVMFPALVGMNRDQFNPKAP